MSRTSGSIADSDNQVSGFVLCTSLGATRSRPALAHLRGEGGRPDGNSEPTPDSYTWTVDTAAPQNDLDASGLSDTISASRNPT